MATLKFVLGGQSCPPRGSPTVWDYLELELSEPVEGIRVLRGSGVSLWHGKDLPFTVEGKVDSRSKFAFKKRNQGHRRTLRYFGNIDLDTGALDGATKSGVLLQLRALAPGISSAAPAAAVPEVVLPPRPSPGDPTTWSGESVNKKGTPTGWQCTITFTPPVAGEPSFTVAGSGTSAWKGRSIPFSLSGSVDAASMSVYLQKLHEGSAKPTVYRGQLEGGTIVASAPRGRARVLLTCDDVTSPAVPGNSSSGDGGGDGDSPPPPSAPSLLRRQLSASAAAPAGPVLTPAVLGRADISFLSGVGRGDAWRIARSCRCVNTLHALLSIGAAQAETFNTHIRPFVDGRAVAAAQAHYAATLSTFASVMTEGERAGARRALLASEGMRALALATSNNYTPTTWGVWGPPLREVFLFLPTADILCMATVCKSWQKQAERNSIWKPLALADLGAPDLRSPLSASYLFWKREYMHMHHQTLFAIRVSFGLHDGASTPQGYVVDQGHSLSAYDDHSYSQSSLPPPPNHILQTRVDATRSRRCVRAGWNLSTRSWARDRAQAWGSWRCRTAAVAAVDGDIVTPNLIHFPVHSLNGASYSGRNAPPTDAPASWSIRVPCGTYLVTVTAGDTMFPSPRHVYVNDEPVRALARSADARSAVTGLSTGSIRVTVTHGGSGSGYAAAPASGSASAWAAGGGGSSSGGGRGETKAGDSGNGDGDGDGDGSGGGVEIVDPSTQRTPDVMFPSLWTRQQLTPGHRQTPRAFGWITVRSRQSPVTHKRDTTRIVAVRICDVRLAVPSHPPPVRGGRGADNKAVLPALNAKVEQVAMTRQQLHQKLAPARQRVAELTEEARLLRQDLEPMVQQVNGRRDRLLERAAADADTREQFLATRIPRLSAAADKLATEVNSLTKGLGRGGRGGRGKLSKKQLASVRREADEAGEAAAAAASVAGLKNRNARRRARALAQRKARGEAYQAALARAKLEADPRQPVAAAAAARLRELKAELAQLTTEQAALPQRRAAEAAAVREQHARQHAHALKPHTAAVAAAAGAEREAAVAQARVRSVSQLARCLPVEDCVTEAFPSVRASDIWPRFLSQFLRWFATHDTPYAAVAFQDQRLARDRRVASALRRLPLFAGNVPFPPIAALAGGGGGGGGDGDAAGAGAGADRLYVHSKLPLPQLPAAQVLLVPSCVQPQLALPDLQSRGAAWL